VAQRYGLIGVAFVLVSWLIVLGLLIVLAAVLSTESDGGAPQSARREGRARAVVVVPPQRPRPGTDTAHGVARPVTSCVARTASSADDRVGPHGVVGEPARAAPARWER
jgi:hypothetical protein